MKAYKIIRLDFETMKAIDAPETNGMIYSKLDSAIERCNKLCVEDLKRDAQTYFVYVFEVE